jgi:hypothetical protein
MPVCPSVHMEEFGFQSAGFHGISYLRRFKKSAEKVKFLIEI